MAALQGTGDGNIMSPQLVDRCAAHLKCSHAMMNDAGVALEKRIPQFRVGSSLGDVVEESDASDLMGDGVNIAARLEGVAKPVGFAYPRRLPERSRLEFRVSDLGPITLKTSPSQCEPMRSKSDRREPSPPKWLRSRAQKSA